MFTLDDLFEQRKIVGIKIEQVLDDRKITKSLLSEKTNISRPTLDKIFRGELSNQVNFEKHIVKILGFLELSPSQLLGRVKHPWTESRKMRNILRCSLEDISKSTGISIEILKQIENGEEVPLAILRDLAMFLGTSVVGLLGEGYFQAQIDGMDLLLQNSEQYSINNPGAFWGHVGILMQGQEKYFWHPITAYTRKIVFESKNKPFIIIPCMDNTLLLINNKYIEELVLLDDACDGPKDMDWNSNVSEGEIPLVFYEAFDDYFFAKDDNEYKNCNMSKNFYEGMKSVIEEYKIDEEEFWYALNSIDIYFANGKIKRHKLKFDIYDDLEETIFSVYEAGELFDGSIIYLMDDEEKELFVNLDNVSYIRLPRTKTEEMISKAMKEMNDDLDDEVEVDIGVELF